MITSKRWQLTGVIGIGCLGTPLLQLWGARPTLPRPPHIDPAALPLRCTASQGALREAAYWWVQAVQVADDECDEAREALREWDPAATFDLQASLRQRLARDRGGFLGEAGRAAQRAVALARTARDRDRAERELALVERTAGRPRGSSTWK